MGLKPGSQLGAYEILDLLGAGGMGEVYRARDPRLRREVAIKIVPPALAADPDRLARFEREAHTVAALSHPNILAIHDFGSDNGVTYAVMELLQGQSLRDALRGGALPRRKAIDCARQIARALDAAHARRVVHRDLKPENVFVTPGGQVKVLDFGLAANRAAAPDSNQTQATTQGDTQPGAILGTPGYMSPEQVRGEVVDHRSDIFSFGCVLYEMLAGRRPFAGESAIDTMHATLRSEPTDLAALADMPVSIARLVHRCLEKAPGERMQSARDLVFALDTLSDTAAPPSIRRTGAAIVAVAVVVLALFGAGWLALGSRTSTGAPAMTASAPRGIAVLPFENLADAEQAYFAAGVTEEVTLQIAKINTLRVMSRNAVARFKDPSAQLAELTRELNIGAVLVGSVRRAGSQVRVSVQLLAAPSGEMMWSERYDRTLDNIFDVQSDIALGVASALRASLSPEERARIERLPTSNTAAYEVFLKQQRLTLTNPTQNAEGLRALDEALALDPKFALAHAVRARRLTFRGNNTGREDYVAALDAARTAVTLDPQLPRAHHALGMALFMVGRVDEARLALQRAIELDANFQTAISDLAINEVNTGRMDHAVHWARRAIPLAPNLAGPYYTLSLPLTFLDDEAAERFLNAAVRRFPSTHPTGGYYLQAMLAAIAMRRGHVDAGLARMREVEAVLAGNAEVRALTNELATYASAPDAAARLDEAVKTTPAGRALWAPYTMRTLRAHLYMRAGQPDRARPLIDAALADIRRAVADGDRSFYPPYEEAALQLMLGNHDAALDLFDTAIDAGALDDKFAKVDPLMAAMRNDPRFVASIAHIERMLAEMRQRADLSALEDLVSAPRD
jgi:TolB-like protein